jgi:hypothetical protein
MKIRDIDRAKRLRFPVPDHVFSQARQMQATANSSDAMLIA